MTSYLGIVAACVVAFLAFCVVMRFLRPYTDRLLTRILGPVLWAIARNTIAQAIRLKAAFIIIGIYVVVVPALPFLIKGDGTLHGLLRVVLAYAFIVASFLLAILTLTLATTTLWSEFREKQIFILQSKPMHRWQLLVGKLLGILTIDAALILFMGIVTWSCVQVIVRQDKWTKGPNRIDLAIAREQVLTTRRVLDPEPLELNDEGIEDYYKKILKQKPHKLRGMSKDKAIALLTKEMTDIVNQVVPYGTRVWRFKGFPAKFPPDVNLTLQFKFAASKTDDSVDEPVRIVWIIGKPTDKVRTRQFWKSYQANELHERQVSAGPISDDGVLEVHIANYDKFGRSMVFAKHSAMKCMFPVGGFTPNLARGLALLFIQVFFLAVLGLFCSTCLTFPVSPIIALSLLLLMFLAGSLQKDFDEQSTWKSKQALADEPLITKFVKVVTVAVRHLLPTFDKYSPTERVSMGLEVSLGSIVGAAFNTVILRGGLLLGLGVLIFHRREVALAVR